MLIVEPTIPLLYYVQFHSRHFCAPKRDTNMADAYKILFNIFVINQLWKTLQSFNLVKKFKRFFFSALYWWNPPIRNVHSLHCSFPYIFLSARYGWTDAIEKLMDRQNARILNLQNSQGKTALHYACSERHDFSAETLLKLGATIERYLSKKKNKSGKIELQNA